MTTQSQTLRLPVQRDLVVRAGGIVATAVVGALVAPTVRSRPLLGIVLAVLLEELFRPLVMAHLAKTLDW